MPAPFEESAGSHNVWKVGRLSKQGELVGERNHDQARG